MLVAAGSSNILPVQGLAFLPESKTNGAIKKKRRTQFFQKTNVLGSLVVELPRFFIKAHVWIEVSSKNCQVGRIEKRSSKWQKVKRS